jgi:hypothetical protein
VALGERLECDVAALERDRSERRERIRRARGRQTTP